MKTVYFIDPLNQHYACTVDVLSRAGLFDEAKRLILDMPLEPDVFVWGAGALLGGCQMHGNVELGEKVAQHLIGIEPLNHAFYVTLCDIYAEAGRFDDLKHTRDVMNDKGIKKVVPGSSMIEIDGTVYEFSVKGSTEAVMEEIKCTLFRLRKEMKREGNTKILEMTNDHLVNWYPLLFPNRRLGAQVSSETLLRRNYILLKIFLGFNPYLLLL